jgi:DNA-binding transcriptional regulator YhcF (GntR family)
MDFDKNIPIYIQIEDKIKLDIITNKYHPGEKIKSVREFALELKINPNTINRALLELEEQGLIITQRTSGKYITEDKNIIEKEKNKLINKKIEEFMNDMKELEIDKTKIIQIIKEKEN